MRIKILLISLVLTLGSWIAVPAWADGVVRVVGVETDDVSQYVKQIERLTAILERLNSPATIRVLVAAYAGPYTGNVIVVVEYASMAELAEEEARGLADEEYTTWLAGLDDIRTIVSDSIYRDISP